MAKRFRYREIVEQPGFRFRIGTGVLEYSAFEVHDHEFAELVFILGGSAMHLTEQEEHLLGAGDVFVINPRVKHGFRDIRGLRLVNIMYDPAQFVPARFLRRLPGYHSLFVLQPAGADGFRSRLRLNARQLAEVVPLLQQMEREYYGQKPGHEAVIQGLFAQVATYLARVWSAPVAAQVSSLHRLADTVSHMERHFTEPLRLEDLAARAHLSVNQFLRVFRRHYHVSPISYLIRLRIQRACELMRSTDRTITQIAFDTGFTDSNYFYRQFKAVMGLGAREWRKKWKESGVRP